MDFESIDDVIKREKSRVFTNRETEIGLFEQLVLMQNNPSVILGITGAGGVGKTELLTEFKRLCKLNDVPYLSIDGYGQKNVLAILARLRYQAQQYSFRSMFDSFDKHMFLYTQMQNSVLNDQKLVDEFRRVLSAHSEDSPSVTTQLNEPTTELNSILIATVTKVEAQAVLETFSRSKDRALKRRPIGNNTYYELGIFGGVPVFMVQSEMGIATPGGALLTVRQAIQDLRPQAIIMCGVAFGLRPDKQELGDILVAKQIQYYEPEKVDLLKGQITRGDRVTSAERLLHRFRSSDNDWQGAQTHFGLVLSGEKLVNDPGFRDWLLKTEPEAIGGDMEGAGLYAAARDAKVDWILVKAICDWADGNKVDDVQPRAARNAAQFVLHVLQMDGWGRPEQLRPSVVDVNQFQSDAALSTLRESFDSASVEFFLNAEDFLTDYMVDALARSTSKRWVLLIDAYEFLSVADEYIRTKLVMKLPSRFRVIIAGRKPFAPEWYNLRPHFRVSHLLDFSEKDTREYLGKRGVNEDELMREIFALTNGHPLLLAMATDSDGLASGSMSSTSDTEVEFIGLESIIRYARDNIKDVRVKYAMEVCSIVRFFDVDSLTYLIGSSFDEKVFEELATLSFIKKRSYGLSLHDAVWQDLNEEYRRKHPLQFIQLNQKAIEFYEALLAQTDQSQWQVYAVEILYHRVATDPEKGLRFLIDIYNSAEALYRLDFCETLIREVQTYQWEIFQKWLLLFEARLANYRDDWDKSRDLYLTLLRDKSIGSEIGAYASGGLGRVYYRLGELDKAERLLRQALGAHEQAQRAQRAIQTALILHNLARIKMAQRKWKEAKKYLERCLVEIDRLLELYSVEITSENSFSFSNAIRREKAAILSSIGTVHFEKGYWNRAFEAFSQSLEIFQSISDSQGVARSLYRIGWTLQQMGKWEDAMDCLEQSRVIFLERGADYWLARVIVKIADLYRLQGDLVLSESKYQECMRICETLNAPLGISVVLDSLGCLYQDMGQMDKSEEMHSQSLLRKREQVFPFEIEITLMNLGELRTRQGRFDEALVYFNESLALMKKMGYRHGEARVLVEMARAGALHEHTRYPIVEWLHRAESLARRNDYHEIQSQVHRIRGNVQASSGKRDLAFVEYEAALSAAKDYNKYFYEQTKRELLAIATSWPKTADTDPGQLLGYLKE